jgi:hypothetical protein
MRKLPVIRPRPTRPDADYYSRLWREAGAYRVNMARKRWCDLSHEHFDWEGFGDRSWFDRRRHLAVLLKAFRRAQIELGAYRGEYQLFASITPSDSSGDAVYVHTPNPNGTPFPITPTGERVARLPPLLSGRIDLMRYQVFRDGHGPSATFTIIPKGLGAP